MRSTLSATYGQCIFCTKIGMKVHILSSILVSRRHAKFQDKLLHLLQLEFCVNSMYSVLGDLEQGYMYVIYANMYGGHQEGTTLSEIFVSI